MCTLRLVVDIPTSVLRGREINRASSQAVELLPHYHFNTYHSVTQSFSMPRRGTLSDAYLNKLNFEGFYSTWRYSSTDHKPSTGFSKTLGWRLSLPEGQPTFKFMASRHQSAATSYDVGSAV